MEGGEKRFGEREFSLILRKAAELQERDAMRPAGAGLTLSEVESIAAEAGIEAKNVRAAVLSLKDGTSSPWRRIVAPSSHMNVQTMIASELNPAALAAIVDAAQAETGRAGSAREVLGGIEWTGKDSMGAVHVIARRSGPETRIQVSTDRKEAAASIAILAPIASLIAGGVVSSAMGGPALIVAGVSAMGGLVAGRLLWGKVRQRWQSRIASLLGRVSAAAEQSSAAEPAGATDPPART